MTQAVFYLLALFAHALFIGALFMVQEFASLGVSLEYGEAVKWSGYLASALLALFFYVNVDYFFISFSLHKVLVSRKNANRELGRLIFYFFKIISWLYVIVIPVATLIFAPTMSFVSKAYVAMFFVLSLGLLSGFLFRSYSQYHALCQSNKWGVLSVW